MRRTDLQITDPERLLSIVGNSTVCHIALAVDSEPYVVTMSYGAVSDSTPGVTEEAHGSREAIGSSRPDEAAVLGGLRLYLHCAGAGKKTDMIRQNPHVCFTIQGRHHVELGDEACHCTVRYESIVGYGTVSFVTDDDERRAGFDAIMRQQGARPPFDYATPALDQVVVLRLSVTGISGKSNLPGGDAG